MSNMSTDQQLNQDPTVNYSKLDRLLEMVPGLLTWLVLTSPIWLSLNLPVAMAYLILFLDVYWFYRAIKTAVLSLIGYRQMHLAMKIDWLARLEADYPDKWQTYEHIFIIPSWKEPDYIIETNLAGLAATNYPKEKIRVILALEDREDAKLKEDKRRVAEKYQSVFANVYVTEHPHGLPGEVIGPGSNRSWSLKSLLGSLREEGVDFSRTILTTLDADFIVHPQFVAGLTYKYLETPAAERKSFTGVFIYANNYWQAPAPMRLIASSLTITQLAELVESWKYVNFSSHSINLAFLMELGFWTVDHVNDDSHLYWRAYFATQGKYEVVPHWLPIYADVVLDQTTARTFVNQYKQLQRWAYGVEHRPYIFRNVFSSGKIPFFSRLERLLFVMRADLIWATVAFITGFGGVIALLVNPAFGDTVLGRNLVFYSGAILTVAFVGLIPAAYLNHRLSPPLPKTWRGIKRVWAFAQVFISPLVLLTFGTIPAIDSQTRLLLGKYLTFRVTQKHRK